ncbi:MAG: hypothetical protein ACLVAP_12420 [Parasutterella sp.]
MTLNRRQLFRLVGAGAALSSPRNNCRCRCSAEVCQTDCRKTHALVL